MHLLAAAGAALLRPNQRFEEKALQGILVVVASEDDVPAATAVAAIRATVIDAGLAPETTASVAALAGANLNRHLIDKLAKLHE